MSFLVHSGYYIPSALEELPISTAAKRELIKHIDIVVQCSICQN
jgi:hypothetical protein